MKAIIRFDPTCDLHRPVPGTNHQERACFQVQVGNKWTAPFTPHELQEYFLAGHIKENGPVEIALDPATALITSSFFNYRAGENRRPGEAAKPEPVAPPAKYNPSGVVKKYHPSLEALKAMGFKSLNHYLRAKQMLPKDANKAPRELSAATKARREAIADLNLDLSGLDL